MRRAFARINFHWFGKKLLHKAHQTNKLNKQQTRTKTPWLLEMYRNLHIISLSLFFEVSRYT